ncbi:UNVERIFIED_CONTAM: hypothetical protein FKN15_032536 [Acipenser sinensis]
MLTGLSHFPLSFVNRNFRKHLRMVGSRRVRAQTFADRREKSFSRSWSDPTPIKTDSLHDSGESADLQASCGALDEDFEDLDWEAEKELEAASCEGDDFVPPKIMLISSKVPRAEYIPTIIRRDDPSIIPILYLFQNLKNLMTPHTIVFESPLELSAQGKQVIETYFDFRLYRLWKTHQHSKLLDYDDIL